eukprot:GHVQ01021686.1.p1 GENE.GHVQ01021686.1~~GHVQ01021686.1.p1  ORF type:complete len:477 (+),score=58.13 GHVQ01021686.1:113-1543(+)
MEFHIQLLCDSKAFCPCPTSDRPMSHTPTTTSTVFTSPPLSSLPSASSQPPPTPTTAPVTCLVPVRTANTRVCPVCIGEPGALPSPNRRMVEAAVKAALALSCNIADVVSFDRKHYFYPDSPKGYQITQHSCPIGTNGRVRLPSGLEVPVPKVQIEEDTGAVLVTKDSIGVDFNRSGIPLVEVVTQALEYSCPDGPAELGKEIRRIMQCAGVSICSMKDGSMRCDVNVSLSSPDHRFPRVELKNLSSFHAVRDSIEYEIMRQAEALDDPSTDSVRLCEETRSWDEGAKVTRYMRAKSSGIDYRFMSEPDLPDTPMQPLLIARWRSELKEMPAAKRERYTFMWGLKPMDALNISRRPEMAKFFEQTVAAGAHPVPTATLLLNEISGFLASTAGFAVALGSCKLTPRKLAEMINLINSNVINKTVAKKLLPQLMTKWDGTVQSLVRSLDVTVVQDVDKIRRVVEEVVSVHPEKIKKFM